MTEVTGAKVMPGGCCADCGCTSSTIWGGGAAWEHLSVNAHRGCSIFSVTVRLIWRVGWRQCEGLQRSVCKGRRRSHTLWGGAGALWRALCCDAALVNLH
jgi:hypothetical protein